MKDILTSSLYLIGSLRNENVPVLGKKLRALGIDVYDDWYGAGHEADDKWKEYELARGRSYREALDGYAAKNVYHLDKSHIDRCDMALLVLPAGRSGHLELGYAIGSGKPGYILLDPATDRWDVMYGFATKIFFNEQELIDEIEEVAFNGH